MTFTGPEEPESITSSSLHFSYQVKVLKSVSPADFQKEALSPQESFNLSENAYGIAPKRPDGWEQEIRLPSLKEAQDLLDTVLNSLGNLQHLFEPRAFCDRLSESYAATVDKTDIWYVELLIVLAVGELLQGKPRSDGTLPGADLYVEAETRLPGIMTLRRKGMMAIEILGTMAFFLQCADLRDDAYIYVRFISPASPILNSSRFIITDDGWNRQEWLYDLLWQTAWRTKAATRILLDLNKLIVAGYGGQSTCKKGMMNYGNESWKLHMKLILPRRLAAATGQPLTIQDSCITTRLPSDSPGFVSIAAMRINIELAKITGQTMDGESFS